jgi:hypothetical protein
VAGKRKNCSEEPSPVQPYVSVCVLPVDVGLRMRGAKSTGSDSQCQSACQALNNDCMFNATFPLSLECSC